MLRGIGGEVDGWMMFAMLDGERASMSANAGSGYRAFAG